MSKARRMEVTMEDGDRVTLRVHATPTGYYNDVLLHAHRPSSVRIGKRVYPADPITSPDGCLRVDVEQVAPEDLAVQQGFCQAGDFRICICYKPQAVAPREKFNHAPKALALSNLAQILSDAINRRREAFEED